MLILRNFCDLIDWKADSWCRVESAAENAKFEFFNWLDRRFDWIVFFRVCQRRFDANIFINMIDACDDDVFLFKKARWKAIFKSFVEFLNQVFHRSQYVDIAKFLLLDWLKNKFEMSNRSNWWKYWIWSI